MHPDVAAVLRRAREVRHLIVQEVAAASPEELTRKPRKRWSARDTLVHLVTCEQMATRMLRHFILGEPFPLTDPLPPDEWNARELARYAHLDAAGAVALLQQTRQALEETAGLATEAHLGRVVRELRRLGDHEYGHLYQIREALSRARGDAVAGELHGLAYARHQVLGLVNLEEYPAAALEWRPASERWSVKETLLHLAIWDRHFARVYAAIADDADVPPWPYPDGELDRWNREQVEALSWMTLSEALHECGEAWALMTAQLRRISPAQWETERARGWHGYREHELHHVETIRAALQAWQA